MKAPIDKLMDVQYVSRWSMVGTDRVQNVATHSFNVAVLAMEIRKRMYNTIDISEMEVCYFAMIHDIREAYTGDIPTPTKQRMKEMGFNPDDTAEDAPEESQPSPKVKAIIKAADLIDCYVFIAEHGAGSRGRVVVAEVYQRLNEFLDGLPEDMRRAARETLEYVLERKSDDPEEGRRIKEHSEKPDKIAAVFRNTPELDRKSLHQPRSA